MAVTENSSFQVSENARDKKSRHASRWCLVLPDASMGHAVSQLVARCPPLDANSVYCNLLQTHHFAATSVAALDEMQQLVGFISAYLIPDQPRTLFVWQVAVDRHVRKQGMALAMLKHILSRPCCREVTHVHTTVTESNAPSNGLFAELAMALSAELQTAVLFDKELHFSGMHDSEILISIGPFMNTFNQPEE